MSRRAPALQQFLGEDLPTGLFPGSLGFGNAVNICWVLPVEGERADRARGDEESVPRPFPATLPALPGSWKQIPHCRDGPCLAVASSAPTDFLERRLVAFAQSRAWSSGRARGKLEQPFRGGVLPSLSR